jgi:hypothetical protein
VKASNRDDPASSPPTGYVPDRAIQAAIPVWLAECSQVLAVIVKEVARSLSSIEGSTIDGVDALQGQTDRSELSACSIG